MGFHNRLNSKDLHAPSRLSVRNDGTTLINKGDVVFIIGYVAADGVYSVAKVDPDYHSTNIQRTEIFGVSDNEVPINVSAEGSVVTFGIVESVAVNGVLSTSRGNTVYIGLANDSSLGVLTIDGSVPGAIPVGTVLGSTSGQADVFMFSLEAGFVRRQFQTNNFRGFYDPTTSTLPNDTLSGTSLATGDYFIASADRTDPQPPFNTANLTTGTLFIVQTLPPGGGASNNPNWVAANYSINLATGSGGGSNLTGQATGTGIFNSSETPTFSANPQVVVSFRNSTSIGTPDGTISVTVPIPAGSTTVADIVNAILSGLNSDTSFSSQYTASVSADGLGNPTLTITANSAGSPYNTQTPVSYLTTTISGVTFTSFQLTGGVGSIVDLSVQGTQLAGNPNINFSQASVPTIDADSVVVGFSNSDQQADISIRDANTDRSGFLSNTLFDSLSPLPTAVPTIVGEYVLRAGATNTWELLNEQIANTRLEITVINGTAGTLQGARAYQLPSTYTPGDTSVTILSTTIKEFSTGLVFLPRPIANTSGREEGVIQGIIDATRSDAEITDPIELVINSSGTFVEQSNSGNYVIGAYLISLATTSAPTRNLIFDGLSTYKVPQRITSVTNISAPVSPETAVNVLASNVPVTDGNANFRGIKSTNTTNLQVSLDANDNTISLTVPTQQSIGEGRLLVSVVNGFTTTPPTTLAEGRAYAITANNFNEIGNVVTISSTTIGADTTGIIWLEKPVSQGLPVNEAGVLKGVVSSGPFNQLPFNSTYINTTINTSGHFLPITSSTSAGAYIVGTYPPSAGGAKDIFFDGLSNTQVGEGEITFGGVSDVTDVAVTTGTGLSVTPGMNTGEVTLALSAATRQSAPGGTPGVPGTITDVDKRKIDELPSALGSDGQILEVSGTAYTPVDQSIKVDTNTTVSNLNIDKTTGLAFNTGTTTLSLDVATPGNTGALPGGDKTKLNSIPLVSTGSSGQILEVNASNDAYELVNLTANAIKARIINNGSITYAGKRSYSLQHVTVNADGTTITINVPAIPQAVLGVVSSGQSGLFYVESENIPPGESGIAVLKGVITNEASVPPSPPANVDLAVNSSGQFASATVGQYVIGSTLSIESVGASGTIAFDGLSNYKFTSGSLPTAFVQSTSIDSGTSVTFTDQGGVETTFTPTPNPTEFVKSTAINTARDKVTFTDQTDATKFFGSPLNIPPSPATNNADTINYNLQRRNNQSFQGGVVVNFPANSIPQSSTTANSGDQFDFEDAQLGFIRVHGRLVSLPTTNPYVFVDTGTVVPTESSTDGPIVGRPIINGNGLAGSIQGGQTATDWIDDFVLLYNTYYRRVNIATTAYRLPGMELSGVFNERVGFFANDTTVNLTVPSTLAQAGTLANTTVVAATGDDRRLTDAALWIPSTLNNINDVDAASPGNNQVLTYDTTSSTWRPEDVASSSSVSINGVTLSNPDFLDSDITWTTNLPNAGDVQPRVSSGINGRINEGQTALAKVDVLVVGPANIGGIGGIIDVSTNGLGNSREVVIGDTLVYSEVELAPGQTVNNFVPTTFTNGTVTGGANSGSASDGEAILVADSTTTLDFKRLKQGLGINLTSELNDVLIETNGKFELIVENNSKINLLRSTIIDFGINSFSNGRIVIPENPPFVTTGQSGCLILENGLGTGKTTSTSTLSGVTVLDDSGTEGFVDITVTNGNVTVTERIDVTGPTESNLTLLTSGLIDSFVTNWRMNSTLNGQYLVERQNFNMILFTPTGFGSTFNGTISIARSNNFGTSLNFSQATITNNSTNNIGPGLLYGLFTEVNGTNTPFFRETTFSVQSSETIFYGSLKIPADEGEIILGNRLPNTDGSASPPLNDTFTFDGLSNAIQPGTSSQGSLANLSDVELEVPLKTGQKIVYTGETAEIRIPIVNSTTLQFNDILTITFPPALRHLNVGGIHGPIHGYELFSQTSAAFESQDGRLRLFVPNADNAGNDLSIKDWLDNSLENVENLFDPQGLNNYNVSATGSVDPKDNLRPNLSYGRWSVEDAGGNVELIFTFNTLVAASDINAITVEFTMPDPNDVNKRVPKSGVQTLVRNAGSAKWINEGGFGQESIRAVYPTGPTIPAFTFVTIGGTPGASGVYFILPFNNSGYLSDFEVYVTTTEIKPETDASVPAGTQHSLVSSGLINNFVSATGSSGDYLDVKKAVTSLGANSGFNPNRAVGRLVINQDNGTFLFEKFSATRMAGLVSNETIEALRSVNPVNNNGASIKTAADGRVFATQPFNTTYMVGRFNYKFPDANNLPVTTPAFFHYPNMFRNNTTDVLDLTDATFDANFWEASNDQFPFVRPRLTATGLQDLVAAIKVDMDMAWEVSWQGNSFGRVGIVLEFYDGVHYHQLDLGETSRAPGLNPGITTFKINTSGPIFVDSRIEFNYPMGTVENVVNPHNLRGQLLVMRDNATNPTRRGGVRIQMYFAPFGGGTGFNGTPQLSTINFSATGANSKNQYNVHYNQLLSIQRLF